MADGEDRADLGAVVRAEAARWGIPGIAVGVWADGEVRRWAHGVANVETGQPVTSGTLFQIGSITKVFVATLVMRLVEEGKLALDAPLVEYLPDLVLADAEIRAGITVRHVLSHTGGLLGDYFPDQGWGDDALSRGVAGMAELPRVTALGGAWSYCNSGFYLAGLAIERVTGKPFETAMTELVFQPLGLERTTFWAHEAITRGRGRAPARGGQGDGGGAAVPAGAGGQPGRRGHLVRRGFAAVRGVSSRRWQRGSAAARQNGG
jgi:CubicO group peptidase (beta-lactamase class C family)